jgi:NitT/TauT family transport system substrate-binding protein
MKRVIITSVLVALITASTLTGCAPAQPAPDAVAVQLSWFHTVEFAGFYTAVEKGFYAAENLAVSLLPGGPDIDPLKSVKDGTAQFGVTSGNELVRARAANTAVTAIMAIFRRSPLVVMSLPDSGIKRPQDLVGKTVGVISDRLDSTWDIQFLALLKQLNIDAQSMKFVTIQDYTGAHELTSGRVQAASGFFSTNEPVQAKLDGLKPNLIFYSDYGIQIYANALFAQDVLLNSQPDLTQRFVRATLKGYQYVLEHPDEAARFALKFDQTLDLTLQTATMEAQIPLIDSGDGLVGSMDLAVWQSTQDALLKQGLLSAPIDLLAMFTNRFIEPFK